MSVTQTALIELSNDIVSKNRERASVQIVNRSSEFIIKSFNLRVSLGGVIM